MSNNCQNDLEWSGDFDMFNYYYNKNIKLSICISMELLLSNLFKFTELKQSTEYIEHKLKNQSYCKVNILY